MLTYQADAFRTFSASVADDAVASIDIPNISAIVLGFAAATDSYFQAYIRASGSLACQTMVIGTAANNAGLTALTGTTGTDGKLNFSANGGKFYIENRLGSSQIIKLTVLGG